MQPLEEQGVDAPTQPVHVLPPTVLHSVLRTRRRPSRRRVQPSPCSSLPEPCYGSPSCTRCSHLHNNPLTASLHAPATCNHSYRQSAQPPCQHLGQVQLHSQQPRRHDSSHGAPCSNLPAIQHSTARTTLTPLVALLNVLWRYFCAIQDTHHASVTS